MTGADHRFVATADIRAAVKGRESDLLDALNIDWRCARPHIRCPYQDHDDNLSVMAVGRAQVSGILHLRSARRTWGLEGRRGDRVRCRNVPAMQLAPHHETQPGAGRGRRTRRSRSRVWRTSARQRHVDRNRHQDWPCISVHASPVHLTAIAATAFRYIGLPPSISYAPERFRATGLAGSDLVWGGGCISR